MGMGGRPSKFTDTLAAEICRRLAEGESLRAICNDDKMPGLTTVRKWLAAESNEEFRLQYARAREEQADFYADEMIEIADTTDDPNKARLQIDARKWKASKLAPKKYGDKIAHTGHDDGPIEVTLSLNAQGDG